MQIRNPKVYGTRPNWLYGPEATTPTPPLLPTEPPTRWERFKENACMGFVWVTFIFLVVASSGLALIAAPWLLNGWDKGSKGQ